jgi:hypothetical protein
MDGSENQLVVVTIYSITVTQPYLRENPKTSLWSPRWPTDLPSGYSMGRKYPTGGYVIGNSLI